MSIEKNISRIFKEIELSKNFLNEVLSDSNELLGGTKVSIPKDGSHRGHKGWASGNAWDIFAPAGTPVYSLSDGVVSTFSDYGPKVIVTGDGKKLFGQGFTVNTFGELPNLFYTHLQNSKVSKGSNIVCGQLLGYIMDFFGGSDHVHIGVETGSIRQFLNNDGTIKCALGQQITGDKVDNLDLDNEFDDNDKELEYVVVDSPNDNIVDNSEVEFEYGGWKKNTKVSENLKRIKNLL